MRDEEVKSAYLDYLINRIGLEKDGDEGYFKLCEHLQDSDFYPLLDMDLNRSTECLNLRCDFDGSLPEDEIYTVDILDEMLSENGTMLELLIVMAEKMVYEMSDSPYEGNLMKWFTELLTNCGIDRYMMNRDFDSERVDEILYTVIFREFGWDGEGGLFPLYLARRDQRRLELVAQMNDYLEENYDIC